MASRAEITTRYAKAYAKASKKDEGLVLDQVVEVTGWSRDNARRRLTAAANRSTGTGRPPTRTVTVLTRQERGARKALVRAITRRFPPPHPSQTVSVDGGLEAVRDRSVSLGGGGLIEQGHGRRCVP